jgi:hypothetical protein
MTGRTAITAGLALALLAGCTSSPRTSRAPASPRPASPQPAPPAGLVAFDSCADLITGLRAALKTSIGRGSARPPLTENEAVPGAAPQRDAAGSDYSTTNTAEAGVDEPDLVKTDGRRIVTIAGGRLHVVDPATRQVTGTLTLPAGQGRLGPYQSGDLLLSGDHALVTLRPSIMPVDTIDGGFAPEMGISQRLLLVDLAGPAPTVLSTYEVTGQVVDSRQVGSVARVVVRSAPPIYTPEQAGKAGLDELLPRYSVSGRAGRVDCTSVVRPSVYSGTSMLTILTLDLSRPALGSGDPVTIAADASTVYSDGPNLYLAAPLGTRTQLYAFDSAGTGRPRYVASGSVPGQLLNQYSLSQWQGDLRVATTGASSSTVYVLRRQGPVLRQVGSVGGLGKGERIYSVRFAGPVGYVVTFRQTDPLYTVDLHDPARPAVTGSLELTGYSAYLHPVGDSQLIGVGQEADRNGRARGTQVSLFDVSNPAKPRRLAHYVLPRTWSAAQNDPHAFLYWPATGLLAIPVTGGTGILALRLTGGTITPLSWPSSPAAQPVRTLVVDRSVWTVAENGLSATNLDTLAPEAWLPF